MSDRSRETSGQVSSNASPRLNRRRVLKTFGASVVMAGLAGCSGNDNDSDDDATETDGDSEGNDDSSGSTQGGAQQSSSIAVVEAYYTANSAEAASEFVHPASDLEPDPAEYVDDFEVEFLEGEIIAEDIDIQALEDENLAVFAITETVLEEVNRDEQTHLVEGTFEYQADGESEEVPQILLPATNDGDWYVLDTPAQTNSF